MNYFKGIFANIIISILFVGSANASFIQSTTPNSVSSYESWTTHELGRVSLATGTNQLIGLTSVATTVDQGWGGQSNSNGVYIALYADNLNLTNTHVAGSAHSSQVFNFDIANNVAAFDIINDALMLIDYNLVSDVTLRMKAHPVGYGGWELHVSEASFTVETDTLQVPEPSILALMGFGLAGLGFSRRRSQS